MVTSAPILQPDSNNYLTPRILFDQFQNNSIELTPFTGSSLATGLPSPQLLLDGSSRGYLNGVVEISASTPVAGQVIAQLPEQISIPQNYNFYVPVNRAGAIVPNVLQFTYVGTGIESVNVTAGGSYTTLATPTLSGPGTGAVLHTVMGVNSVTIGNPGINYAPGDVITGQAGNGVSVPAQLLVNQTQVVSATVYNGGSGGTNGTQTVTGTTGTGTMFQASVTVTNGTITAVNSITVQGVYTQNPRLVSVEPVTGAGLVGATLSVVTGVYSVVVQNPGAYTILPGSNFIIQGNATGFGTGANFIAAFKVERVIISTPGTGYTSASTIAFGGTGSGAAGTLVLGSLGNQVNISLMGAPETGDMIYLDGVMFFTNSYTI